MKKKSEYQSVFISDLHLGTKLCQDDKLLEFLKSFETEQLFLVGDAIDLWSLNRQYYWSKTQTEILRRILKISEKSSVYYLLGNHDESFRKVIAHNNLGMEVFGQIFIKNEHHYSALDGSHILVTHGDQWDLSMKIPRFFFTLTDYLFSFLPKPKLEALTTFANRITSTQSVATRFVEKNERFDAVLMGHTHIPKKTDKYLNCGDWVTNCSYLTEDLDGQWNLNFF